MSEPIQGYGQITKVGYTDDGMVFLNFGLNDPNTGRPYEAMAIWKPEHAVKIAKELMQAADLAHSKTGNIIIL